MKSLLTTRSRPSMAFKLLRQLLPHGRQTLAVPAVWRVEFHLSRRVPRGRRGLKSTNQMEVCSWENHHCGMVRPRFNTTGITG